MKNKKIFGMMSLVLLTALSGCNNDKRTKVQFWTGFGKNVNDVLEPLLRRFETINPDIKVEYSTKEGYDNLLQAMTSSISNNAYPHIANGYPDHFATYANSSVLIDLNTPTYIKNEQVGLDVDQFLPNYMTENTSLIPGAITGLPFNKSTEVMVVNQSFFDVAAQHANPGELVKIPETWQELALVGKALKRIVVDKGWIGKLVKHDGSTVEKSTNPPKSEIAFDMSAVTKADDFIPFSWDSTANFFITILRQWGSEYTEQGDTFQKGNAVFHKEENLQKTLDALTYFQDLYVNKIIGIPVTFGESLYSSKPFMDNKLVLSVSSSAGIRSNMPGTKPYPFEVSVSKIPYNAENPEAKYVISQGTNLGLFTRGKMSDERTRLERAAAWKLLRYLTYEVTFEFGKGTAYFPVIDGSLLTEDNNDPRYVDYTNYNEFLASEITDKTEAAIRDTAKVQAEGYQEKDEEGVQIWHQFVDPGFLGSSRIRNEVSFIMGQLFADSKTPQKAIQDVVAKLTGLV